MKLTTKRDKRTELEKEIDDVIKMLREIIDTSSDEYKAKLTVLERLMVLKEEKKKISPDTIAVIVGNILGIGLILSYEKINVISTKALGFVLRGRV